jgi:hypothetical protein
MFNVEENLKQLQEEIAPYTPNIIAVTKYFGIEGIEDAYQAGLRDFGESRIPESIEKINSLKDEIRNNSKFHLIGHLQKNKAKKAVESFDFIHSVDSIELAKKISQEALEIGKIQKVFLQVNNAEEPQKYGFLKSELYKNFDEIVKLEGLDVIGLMNIAPLTEDREVISDLFSEVRKIRDNLGLKELSMGMSNDYKEAVENGATYIRVGRKLFS